MKTNDKTFRLAVILGLLFSCEAVAGAFETDSALVERGRYVAVVSGCNDCHTAGYAAGDGAVPESEWLKGDSFGWSGPWGTTYGTNLRLFVAGLSEDQWVEASKTLRRRPPMPWFNLNRMSDGDLRALYHFIRSLGDLGDQAPAALLPDQLPTGPRAQWVLE